MKVIDLLNKIANGEKVPKKIRCFLHEGDNDIFTYIEEAEEYHNGYGYMRFPNHHLNDEVEVIEEYETFEEEIKELDMLPDNEQYSNKILYGTINKLIRKVSNLKKGTNK